MPNKNNAVDDFLNQVQGDNKDMLEPEKDPFANLNLEQKVEGEEKVEGDDKEEKEEKEEKPLSFHQDPKVRKYIEKEVKRLTEHLSPRQAEDIRTAVKDEDDLVGAFTAIIGNDTPDKVAALQKLGKFVENVKAEASSARNMREAEIQAEREAQDALTRGFETIEDEFDVDISSTAPQARKDRSDFIDFMKRVAPKNEDGEIVEYPDFRETFTLFQELKKKPAASNTRAKELAARGMERSSNASANQVPADASWKAVDKFFSTLK